MEYSKRPLKYFKTPLKELYPTYTIIPEASLNAFKIHPKHLETLTLTLRLLEFPWCPPKLF